MAPPQFHASSSPTRLSEQLQIQLTKEQEALETAQAQLIDLQNRFDELRRQVESTQLALERAVLLEEEKRAYYYSSSQKPIIEHHHPMWEAQDVCLLLWSFLRKEELGRIALCCRKWYHDLFMSSEEKNDSFWKEIVTRDMPQGIPPVVTSDYRSFYRRLSTVKTQRWPPDADDNNKHSSLSETAPFQGDEYYIIVKVTYRSDESLFHSSSSSNDKMNDDDRRSPSPMLTWTQTIQLERLKSESEIVLTFRPQYPLHILAIGDDDDGDAYYDEDQDILRCQVSILRSIDNKMTSLLHPSSDNCVGTSLRPLDFGTAASLMSCTDRIGGIYYYDTGTDDHDDNDDDDDNGKHWVDLKTRLEVLSTNYHFDSHHHTTSTYDRHSSDDDEEEHASIDYCRVEEVTLKLAIWMMDENNRFMQKFKTFMLPHVLQMANVPWS